MIDQCWRCTVRGDLAKCQDTECSIRDSWVVKELLKENEALQREVTVLVGVEVRGGDCPPQYACRQKPDDEDGLSLGTCFECWSAWAKQRAAQAGKDGSNE